MASVLSLTANSPLGISSLRNDASGRSCSSAASIGSSGTVQHHRIRSISTASLSSVGSCLLPSRAFGRRTDNSSDTPHSASSTNLNLNLGKLRSQLDLRSSTAATSRRSSLVSAFSPSSPPEHRASKLVDVVEGEDGIGKLVQSKDGALPKLKPAHPEGPEESIADSSTSPFVDNTDSILPQPAFQRWLDTLRKKRHSLPQPVVQRGERWSLDDFDHPMCSPEKQRKLGHNTSDSQGSSSLGFVTAVKSATATLASASVVTVSRRATKWRRGQQRSSLLSGSDPRHSVDSQRSFSDDAAKERARKRRAKVEELIRTEESYVGDLKALSNVCCCCCCRFCCCRCRCNRASSSYTADMYRPTSPSSAITRPPPVLQDDPPRKPLLTYCIFTMTSWAASIEQFHSQSTIRAPHVSRRRFEATTDGIVLMLYRHERRHHDQCSLLSVEGDDRSI